jgi:hypothetical protein
MKNQKQSTSKTIGSKTTNKTKSTTTSASTSSKQNTSKKPANDKTKDKKVTNKNKINTSKKESDNQKEKIIFDFKEIAKPSLITTNEQVNFNLYLELMNNLDKKDDLKTLAICRLILAQDPNNSKVKDLHDVIYESVKEQYYESGELEPPKEEKMDKHMKLNKDGEYEYCFSDDESEDEK